MMQIHLSLNDTVILKHDLEIGKTYIVGREESCDIRIDDNAISRRHISIESQDGTTWTVRKLSRHGKMLRGSGNLETVDILADQEVQIPPYSLTIVNAFVQSEPSREDHAEATPAPRQPTAGAFDSRRDLLRIGPSNHHETSDDDSSDRTQIQIFAPKQPSTEIPHLLIENPQGEIVRLRLEGEQWTVGRDESMAQILVPDLKCSRRHLQIHLTRGEYFVEDLASTQGTELNEKPLAAHQLQKLYSGDVLQVGDYRLTFELHDAKFESQLRLLPAELLAPIDSEEYHAENGTHLPVFGDPTNFVVPHRALGPADYLSARYLRTVPKKYLMAAASIALLFMYVLASGGGKGGVHSTSQTSLSQDPFDRLTSEQKQYIISSYNLGDTFMKRRNYDAALREFQKIHELIPSYQKSRDYEEAARHAMEAVEQKRSIEEQQKKEDEVRRMVDEVITACQTRMATFHNFAALESCLAPVNDLDPSNKTVESMKSQFQNAEELRDQNRSAREAAADGIRRGETMYRRAEELKHKGQIQSAIAAFQAHINANISDPRNLKQQSRREIASLQSGLKEKTDQLMTEANSMYAANQLRESGAKLEQVLTMDPQNEKARTLKAKVKNDMNHRMKVIYGDSILLESLGNIDEAREKWKNIVKSDLPDGEYGVKAKSKISKYGEK